MVKYKCISGFKHNGKVGILQIFYNNSKVAKYARLRQYKGYNSQRKPVFTYTKIPITPEIQALLTEKLRQQKAVGQQQKNIGQQKATLGQQEHIDLNKPKSSSFPENNMETRAKYEFLHLKKVVNYLFFLTLNQRKQSP